MILLSQEGSLFLKNYYWITTVPGDYIPFLYMACFHSFCPIGVIKLLYHISQETGNHPYCLDIDPEGSQGSQGRVTMLWVFAPYCLIRRRKWDLLQAAWSILTVTGIVGEFNYHDLCWTSNTIKHKQPRCFLESTDGDFLTQIAEDHTRNGVMFDLILTQK